MPNKSRADADGFDKSAWGATMLSHLGAQPDEAEKAVADRLARERRSNATKKQRAKRAKRTEAVHFRTTPVVKAMLEAIMHRHGLSRTRALDFAVEAAFKRMNETSGGEDVADAS